MKVASGEMSCSFCGKRRHEVRRLIAGPTVFICNECVGLCVGILRGAGPEQCAEDKDRRPAYWTHEDGPGGHLYYFAPTIAATPPYLEQREVKAILDIAADGTLAGVELIDDMPPPPGDA